MQWRGWGSVPQHTERQCKGANGILPYQEAEVPLEVEDVLGQGAPSRLLTTF